MKKIIVFYSFILLAGIKAFSCDFTVNLHDTYGDSWNGNSITVYVNGTAVLTDITVTTGYDATFTFTADLDDVVSITYDASGSYTYENEITIVNINNSTVFSDGLDGATPMGGTFTVGVDCGLAPPSNDDPCNAINVPVAALCNMIVFDNSFATNSGEPDPGCGNYNGADLWFVTTFPASGLLTIETEALIVTDGVLGIYSSPTNNCNNLVLDQCFDNGTTMPVLTLNSYTPGDMIWIRFWEDGGDNNGTFSMCITDLAGPPACSASEPADDECSNATMICSLEGYCGNTSSDYSVGTNDPSGIFCGSIDNSSWVSFVAGDVTATLNVWVSNCSNGDGIQMEIYGTNDCQNYASYSNCWNPGVMEDGTITATGLTVGETYYLMIDGWAGDVCDYVVSAGEGVLTADAIVVETGISTASICGGCVHLEASGGTSYQWSPAASLDDPNIANPIACPTSTTTYTVTVTGGNIDCPSNATASTTVTVDAQYSSVIVGTNPICNGDASGTATVTLSDLGTSTSFTYTWSNSVIHGPTSDTVDVITGLTAGTYSVSIIDQTGDCESVLSVTLVDPTALSLDLSMTPTYCGGTDGTISVAVNDGAAPYDVTWTDTNNSSTTNGNTTGVANNYTITNLEAVTYNITLIDNNSCEAISSIEVQDSLALASEMSVSADQCLIGNSFDFTDLSGAGASINYQVTSPSLVTQVFPGSPDYTNFQANEAGTWTVIQIVSSGGCTNSDTLTFEVFPQPVIDALVEDVSCMDGSDGSIIASSSIAGTYHMMTSTGSFTGSLADNLTAGQYKFYVSTINACTDTLEIDINQPDSLLLTISNVDAICETAGSATVVATGGTEPYNYLWNDISAQTNAVASNIFEGQYNCVVTDANGCVNNISTELQNINVFESNLQVLSNASCFGASDGVIESSPLGGTSPFTYEWSDAIGNPSQNGVHSNLAAGFYEVTLTDSHGCSSIKNITVTQPTELVLTFGYEVPTCFGYADGQAWVSASGAADPYTYLWSNGIISETNINIPSGEYSVVVTDANGCSKTISNIAINQPNEVVLALEYEPAICIGQTAEIRMAATSSPFSPYSFYWNNLLSTDILEVSPIETTVYSAQVIDAHGCESIIKEVEVVVHPALEIEAYPSSHVICKGETVAVGLISSGGNGNYSYRLLDGTPLSSEPILNPTHTTDFAIIVSDDCGSPEDTAYFTIEVQEAPIPSFHADVRQGCAPLEVNFIQDTDTQEEGTQYVWDFGGNGNVNTSLEVSPSHLFKQEGYYHVSLEIITPYGCKSQTSEYNYIYAFPVPVASFILEPNSASILNPSIYFNNQSLGANQSIWYFGDGDTSQAWSPLHKYPVQANEYISQLVALNRFACSDTITQRILINEEITLYLPTAFTPDNDGKNEFFIAKGHGVVDQPFEMIVYDRWGEVVFKSDSMKEGWSGIVKGGDYAKPGIYSYYIKFEDVQKVPHERSGFVNLIR